MSLSNSHKLSSIDLRKKFIKFFSERGHIEIASSSLVPEGDSTTLFTGSGMQPLIPYLIGEPHPQGTRLVDIQRCFRAEDLDEVGVTRCHHTFFEMMGNWSLGDYFKEEQISWALDFFVKEVGLDVSKLYITVFEGDNEIPKDDESINIWKQAFAKYDIDAKEGDKYLVSQKGQEALRIFAYPREKNWWERSGAKAGDPAGPDSEIFFDTGKAHDPNFGPKCHVNCDCRRFIEICNNVFMQYQKQADGSYKPLKNKNVDVGYGFERILLAANNVVTTFETDLFLPLIIELETLADKKYGEDQELDKAFRTIADHIRASCMLLADGVLPSNKEQGYMLRRLIRRALRFARKLGITKGFTKDLAQIVFAQIFKDAYPHLHSKKELVIKELALEEERFGKVIDTGLKKLEHLLAFNGVADSTLSGEEAFMLYETYGFPLELIIEVAGEIGAKVDIDTFNKLFEEHKQKSKGATEGKFKGGLEGTSDMHIKYHTATHLLQQALREVLGVHVHQMGSNITTERLRFDFSHDSKMTTEQLRAVEDIVNLKIGDAIDVNYIDLPFEKAQKTEALHFFGEKYGNIVRVYYVGPTLEKAYSKEFCGGPHIKNTKELGIFKILKEEAVSSGIRRIKAVLS